MKTNILNKVCVMLLTFFIGIANAQDGYTYTLIDNGGNNFSIGLVPPLADGKSNFRGMIAQYGFAILLPDGVTATLVSSYGDEAIEGGGANATFFDGAQVGVDDKDGYLIVNSKPIPDGTLPLPEPSEGVTVIATIQLDESSLSEGNIELLANNTVLVGNFKALQSFIQIDSIDDNNVAFVNGISDSESGLSGDTSFVINIEVLSIEENELINFSVHPNPIQDKFTIADRGDVDFDAVKLFNITGKLVKDIDPESVNDSLDISSFQSGVYFLELRLGNSIKTLKLVKL